MDKKRVNGWQDSVHKIGANLQTVIYLVCVSGDFLGCISTRVTLTQRTKGKWYGWKIRARPCVRVCVPTCACARRHVRVCVRVGEGFRFAFLFAWVRARGCVRVCVCACGRGGLQGRPYFGAGAGALDLYDTPRTQRDKLLSKGISCFPRTQRDKLFTFTTTQGLSLPTTQWPLSLPTNPRVILSHEPKGYLSLGYLSIRLLLGNW